MLQCCAHRTYALHNLIINDNNTILYDYCYVYYYYYYYYVLSIVGCRRFPARSSQLRIIKNTKTNDNNDLNIKTD